jgi:uncharacterized MAPEG superfamily protein
MTHELNILVWVLILTIVQILLVATLRTRESGLAYNASSRDVPSPVPVGIVTGRMMRAQRNLLETLPVFIAAIIMIQFAQIQSKEVHYGALLYFWARVLYIPLYAFGVTYVRSLAWAASLAGIVMLLHSLLTAA